MMVQKLSSVVRIEAQQRERQTLLHLASGCQHAGRALVPHRPTFGPEGAQFTALDPPQCHTYTVDDFG